MRIEVGKSKLKFSRMINGTSDIYPDNHTIEGNLTSLEHTFFRCQQCLGHTSST
jgi:hypothetical protein